MKKNNSEDHKKEVIEKVELNLAKGEKFFSELKLADFEKLIESSKDRNECPKCKKKRKFYCYDCFIPISSPELLPEVKLPVHVAMYREIYIPSI